MLVDFSFNQFVGKVGQQFQFHSLQAASHRWQAVRQIHARMQWTLFSHTNRKMLLAKDSILQKQRRRLLVLCAKFCGSSVIIQCIENEIIQAQSCRTSPAHNGQCVLRNEDMSDIVVATCNILKAANAILSCSAGVALRHLCFFGSWQNSTAFNCLKYKHTVHQLLLVHQNLSVAPRSVVNKHILYAILEATICGIFLLPFNSYELLSLEGSHGKMSYYRVEYVTALASFLKIFYPLQLLIDNVLDKFNNSLVLRKLAYFNPNTQFALKIIIRNNPLFFAFVSWCSVLGLGAYILRIAEAPAAENAMDYSQMLYLAVVASFTLGYGDVVPKTYVGRTVLAACIAAGLFLIAISIVFMGSFLELKSGERHIVKIYSHAQMMKALENGAASFLTKWLRLMIQKKKRRGKWSVELHWTVLEEVSSKASANFKWRWKNYRLEYGGRFAADWCEYFEFPREFEDNSSTLHMWQVRHASFELWAALGQRCAIEPGSQSRYRCCRSTGWWSQYKTASNFQAVSCSGI